MKEAVIFIVLFLIVFAFALIIFNGRFIYTQMKYQFLGPPPVFKNPFFAKFPLSGDVTRFDKLIIPIIGLEAPIVLPETTDEYILQKSLEQGVVLYPDSNVFLGHSSAYPWYRGSYGSVFSLLNKLNIGDEILVFSNDKKYTYQVLEKEIKMPKDLNFEEAKGNSIIYLVSCWPINTAWKRIVIKAKTLDND